MKIVEIAAIAIAGVILTSTMKSIRQEYCIYIILTTVIVIFISIFDYVSQIFDFFSSISTRITYGQEFMTIIIKVLAISYVSDFTSEICIDAGEGGIASKVQFAGKVLIFIVSLPVFQSVMDIIDAVV